MSSGGAVQLVDIAQSPTPDLLAEAIKGAMQTNGFLFLLNHGLEKQAEEMFTISGELYTSSAPRRPLTASPAFIEDFFGQETAEEKLRCAYDNNRGYTRVSQEVYVALISRRP